MKTAFVDTSYLIALELQTDQDHKAAKTHWETYREKDQLLVTTSCIFDELVTYLMSRNKHDKAVDVGEKLLLSSAFHLIHIDDDLFNLGWDRFKSRPDKSFSLTDCISFVTMELSEIQTVLTFDKHFSQAGFQVLPEISQRIKRKK